MADRTERSLQSREKTTRRKPWAPPSRLEAPAPKEGYRHRWIRTQLRGEDDSINVHSKLVSYKYPLHNFPKSCSEFCRRCPPLQS